MRDGKQRGEAEVLTVGATTVGEDADDGSNPILPDVRDKGGEEVLELAAWSSFKNRSGAGPKRRSFYWRRLCRPGAMGLRRDNYADVAGQRYLPSHTGFVVRLAKKITEAAGGRVSVTKNRVTIASGMDTFIWPRSGNHDRSLKAWESRWCQPPYSHNDWLSPCSSRHPATGRPNPAQ